MVSGGSKEAAILYNICGFRLYQKQLYESAKEQFILSFYYDSSNGQPLYNLACVCALTEQFYDAMDYLKQAIDLDPKFKEKAKQDPDFAEMRDNWGYLFKNAIGE